MIQTMSSTKRTVELKPPNGKQTKEILTSPGHVCGYCKGIGYFRGSYLHSDEDPTTCPVCDGTGQVDAIVTIEWKPSKK